MGCAFAKEEKQGLNVQTCSFYVETKLDPVPKGAERDWETLLWRNNMSSDQENIDHASEKLRDGKKILQIDRNNFDDMVSDLDGQMLERQMSLTLNQDSLKDDLYIFKRRESDFSAQIQIREEELKEKEESFEQKKTNKETHICIAMRSLETEKAQLEAVFQKHQKCKEEFKQKEELFTISDKHLKQGKLLESEQIILKENTEKILITFNIFP